MLYGLTKQYLNPVMYKFQLSGAYLFKYQLKEEPKSKESIQLICKEIRLFLNPESFHSCYSKQQISTVGSLQQTTSSTLNQISADHFITALDLSQHEIRTALTSHQ